MEYIEVTGKSVDEAITNACLKLETSSDNIEYEVIEKGSTGLLGLFTKPAKIKARIKSGVGSVDAEFKAFEKKEKEVIKEAAEVKKEAPKKEYVKNEAAVKEQAKNLEKKPVGSTHEPENKEIKAAEPAKATPKAVLSNEEIESRITNFLGDMFEAMDIPVEIKVTFDGEDECVNVELLGENMGLLIGKRGQTLDSIQYLTSLVINKGKEKYVRIKVDTENYRQRRKDTLESLAKNIAYKVKRSRRSVALEPMNPYERRIIHSALQNDRFVSTKSEGEEPFRHVVVYLDREKSGNNRYSRQNYNENRNYNDNRSYNENKEDKVKKHNDILLVKGCCGIITTAAFFNVWNIEQESVYGADNSSNINKYYVKWRNKYSKA